MGRSGGRFGLLLAAAIHNCAAQLDPALECTAFALPDGLSGGWALAMLPGLPHGSSVAQRSAWEGKLKHARAACQSGYNSSVYGRADLRWTQAAYATPQMHAFDRFFYQPGACSPAPCPRRRSRLTCQAHREVRVSQGWDSLWAAGSRTSKTDTAA